MERRKMVEDVAKIQSRQTISSLATFRVSHQPTPSPLMGVVLPTKARWLEEWDQLRLQVMLK